MSWFNTVEFYVIAGTVAAAAVAFAALPKKRTEAVTHLLAGDLLFDTPGQPSLEMWVDDNRRVHLRRTGLDTMGDRGAVSLVVNVAGFDVTIDERITFDRRGDNAVNAAEFVLDFFGRERYHICYRDDTGGVLTAFTLPVTEGVRIQRTLSL